MSERRTLSDSEIGAQVEGVPLQGEFTLVNRPAGESTGLRSSSMPFVPYSEEEMQGWRENVLPIIEENRVWRRESRKQNITFY